MSDFTPVALVKGDVEFLASTAVDYVNAVYGAGFSPVVEPTVPDPLVVPESDETGAEVETPEDAPVDPETPAEDPKAAVVHRPRKPREGATA